MTSKKPLLCILAISLVAATATAQASQITRAQFETTAVTYGFENSAVGALTPSDGFLTVSGAHVTGNTPPGQSDLTYTNDGQYSTVAGAAMRFSFASTVSAVGFNAYYNNAPILFQVFNSQNVLLDSISTSPTDCGDICGFVGLRADGISYAIASLPTVQTHNLYADNIIYQAQSQSVPEPASIVLLGIGALALGLRRRMAK